MPIPANDGDPKLFEDKLYITAYFGSPGLAALGRHTSVHVYVENGDGGIWRICGVKGTI
jgi:hypothetical protein